MIFLESTDRAASVVRTSNFSIVTQDFKIMGFVSKHDFGCKNMLLFQTSFSYSSNLDINGLIPPVSRSNQGLHFLSNNQAAIFSH